MNNTGKILGIDVGGSHISAALADLSEKIILQDTYRKISMDPACSPADFVNQLVKLILSYQKKSTIEKIGFSFPGPFDYQQGISLIENLGKYDKLYGLNILQSLKSNLNSGIEILFDNDAACFVLGEYFAKNLNRFTKVIGITLGTGFGSSFLSNGILQKGKKGVPVNGFLYDQKFRNGIADDYFSTRWLIQRYFKLTARTILGGKDLFDLATEGNKAALIIFDEFGENLASFLTPFLINFQAECLIIGGNIGKAWEFINPAFQRNVILSGKPEIFLSGENENTTMLGAAMLFQNKNEENESRINSFRKTSQFLKPSVYKPLEKGAYDIYPAFEIGENKIAAGYEKIVDYIIENKTIVLDGYLGVFWENIIGKISRSLAEKGENALFFDFKTALKPEEEIEEMIAGNMGKSDSIFGKRCNKKLIDFFEINKINSYKPDKSSKINVLYGCGSALSDWNAAIIYFDVPKNEIQFRMRASKIMNLGARKTFDPKIMYKRFYFVDWVVLNSHKLEIKEQINLFVDAQDTDVPLSMTSLDLREGLNEMSRNYFRVRPWFEPGVWGGTWIKNKIHGLSQDVPNYAWSFEMIVPENGIMFKSNNLLFEISFDFLMFNEAENILGNAFPVFGYEFPIRFDFLDTFDGGNLSIQCHPRPEYIKEAFGENFTQDETYYILDTKENACVYLGFHDNIDSEEFKLSLEKSYQTKSAIEITKYIQSLPAQKHDLFLIPNGTVHGSGKNNLVLEISSTPYIFTFKMYDWLRLDIDGQPRPINIDHAFKNLYFDRKGKRIQDEFISHPDLLQKGKDFEIFNLPTHPNHFYQVERIEFDGIVDCKTNNNCHVCMLVQGDWLILETENGYRQVFNYAETFVIPAAALSYKLINQNNAKLKLVRAFVKNNPKIDKNEIDY